MFTTILVPVDLAHTARMGRALAIAASEARQHGARIIYLGITEETPGPVAHNPREYAERLEAFARAEADRHGIAAEALAVASVDPAAEINRLILKAIRDTGADHVVMASHPPRMLDWILPSHGGHVAEHAEVSVFVVR
jgi:nucleotide-binding universal stress UspA family protein